ncbi:hypothetical protein [Vibrio rhizosphaerae]|uniref:hypothetical protein n=1 Tax=Vibrio rhizosphaerae TaxID=398736 RepID=UPI00056F0E55|nr:hypothetical protein [Vibrio rhizosphaerae]
MKKLLSATLLLSLFSFQAFATDDVSFTTPKVNTLFQNENVKSYSYSGIYSDYGSVNGNDIIFVTNDGELKLLEKDGETYKTPVTLVSGESIRSAKTVNIDEVKYIEYITEDGQVKYIQRNDNRPSETNSGLWDLTFNSDNSQMRVKIIYQEYRLNDGTTGYISDDFDINYDSRTYREFTGKYKGKEFIATRVYE